MKIKGIEFEFYCSKCKKPVKDIGSNKSVNAASYCNCTTSQTETDKFNGARFNKEYKGL